MLGRRLLLLDLSNNNSVQTLAHARTAGIVGCWLKVSEGDTFADPTYKHLRQLAHDGGLRSGGYHFARPGRGDAAQQAEAFASLLGPIGRRDLRPVLDLEVDGELPNGGDRNEWAARFLHTFRARTGVCCILYSYGAYLAGLAAPRPLGCGLWLAAYGRNDGSEQAYHVPPPWQRAVAHQFTSRGRVPGIAGDVDVTSARSLRPLLAHGLRGL